MPEAPRRGVYRSVYCRIQEAPEYLALTSRARFVLLSARLSKEAGIACIWSCFPETLARLTGYDLRHITTALDELDMAGWTRREGSLLWIVNGLRYDPNVNLANPNHRTAVERRLADLPRCRLVLTFCEYYGMGIPSGYHPGSHPDTIPYTIPIQDQDQEQLLRSKDSTLGDMRQGGSHPDGIRIPSPPLPQNGSAAQHVRQTARDLLAFLNEKTGRHFRPVPENLSLLEARLKSGAEPRHVRAVVARKVREWTGDAKMQRFLRPATLFAARNFEQYIGELPATAFEPEPPEEDDADAQT